MSGTRIGLEIGSKWVFACAVDWPGPGFRAGAPEVIGRVDGNATTDFGAPGVPGLWDDEPLDGGEPTRLVGLLRSSWDALDDAVAAAPAVLPKGPRSGGRDRDDIADHVREAERTYARKAGVRVPLRTPWGEQRA